MTIYDMLVNAVNEAENFDSALTLDNCRQSTVDPAFIHCCQHCGKSYYMERYSTRTCIGWTPVYKDSVLMNSNPNVTTTYCQCLNCGKAFSFKN